LQNDVACFFETKKHHRKLFGYLPGVLTQTAIAASVRRMTAGKSCGLK
jgi:hypothetical protein